jgi:hypothetical protein
MSYDFTVFSSETGRFLYPISNPEHIPIMLINETAGILALY